MKYILIFFSFFAFTQARTVAENVALADAALYTGTVTAKGVDYTGEYGLVLAFAGSGNGADIYPLDAAWALPELFQATGNKKYLNDALDLYYTLFQSASPSNTLPQSPQGYNDTYLSWHADSGATNLSGYLSGGVGQSVLQESRGLMHLAKILWIMDNSPVLMTETNSKTNRTYQSEFDYLLNNLQVNFWEKWISRRGASAYTFGGVDQTAAWDYIAVHLYQITGLQRYKDLNDRVYFNIDRNNTQPPENQSEASQIGFEELIVPNNANPNAVQWCGDWACREYLYSGQLETVQDYIHAGRVVKNFIANIELGMPHYPTSLIPKLINTVPVFWPESFANSREIYYWMDGRHWAAPEGREEYHAMTEGWYTMGRWDADLRNRFENVNQQILDYYVENRQLSMHHGANAFNTAYVNRTLQYPEQNLNYIDLNSSAITQPTIFLDDSHMTKGHLTSLGHGANTTGGRGGNIYEVTNLNSSGAGSLANGIETGSRPRTIVFTNVSGIIRHSGSDYLDIGSGDGDLTIAGETSPNGIIINGELRISDSNVIVSHIDIMGDNGTSGSNLAAIRVVNYGSSPIENILIDHVGMMGAKDETVTITSTPNNGQVRNITVSNSIVSDNIGAGYGTIQYLHTENVTWHQVYYNRLTERNGPRSSTADASAEIINNYIYNYTGSAIQATYGNDYDLIGNWWDTAGNSPLPFGNDRVFELIAQSSSNETASGNVGTLSNSNVFYDDNIFEGSPATYGSNAVSRLQSARQVSSGITPYPSSDVRDSVTLNAGSGARLDRGRNTYFQARINEGINRTQSSRLTSFSYPSDFPTISNGSGYTDSDNDGLSDAWEMLNGGLSIDQNTILQKAMVNGIVIDQEENVTVSDANKRTALDMFLTELRKDDRFLPKTNVTSLLNLSTLKSKQAKEYHTIILSQD